ncbi:MAG: amino acid adenylation domain-containing protein [Thermosynechococcaceae cyanobacterium MS004]|nr:amino acid adenylation domain-containing protein [Thermosynechococcaceae cyanobacterium MS004]
MSSLSDRLAALSPAQRALFLQKLQTQAKQQAIPALSIPTADRTQPLRLSFPQQRLWFLSQFEGSQSAYNIPVALRLEGQLQEDLLVQSLQAIADRHEILRTHFVLHQGEPLQVVAERLELPLERLDWRSLPSDRLESTLQATLLEESQHSFNLQTGPLYRIVLIQTAPTVHYLVATLHHIITDGWSMGVLVQELVAHYKTQGQRDAMPPLALQYVDYAQWQREWLAQPEAAQQLAYWKEHLKGMSPLLELPTDHPRPSLQTFRGQTLKTSLDTELTRGLNAIAQSTGATLFMVLEAAFALFLSRLSRQRDIPIGTPVANRNTSELEPMIGFFVNTLILRNDVSGNPTVRELLERTKRLALEAYRNQDIPFERLVEAIQPARTLSHSPLFQVMFSFQNTPEMALELPNLTLTSVPIPNATAKFDLLLTMYESAGQLSADWEYNCDLFDGDTIERFAEHFQTLLGQMVQQPDAPIDSLSLLSSQVHQQIVYDWNNTATEFIDSFLLHGGFEAQVQKNPEAIALLYENQTISYQTLNHRANQVAHRLKELGVGTETLVGVYGERSPDLVVGLLAILKAGGAYIPLDPSSPPDRIAEMLEDAQPLVILTQRQFVERLPQHQSQVLCLDQPDTFAHYPTRNLGLEIAPDQLAYIIYTSGSTGKPKGVMISHRGAVNTNLDINQRFRVGAGDRVISLASLSFDLSVYDIFGLLAAGGGIVIPVAKDALNPVAWLQLMHQHRVTFWDTAPAVMEMLMTTVIQQKLRLPDSLRIVMMSGDAISVTLPEQIRSHAQPQIQIYSFGGATEGSIWSICYPIGTVEPHWTSIPYGKPISNQRFHILDAHLNPVPIGVPGELHIGGTGVALGYFNRPELTAARFIPDPFFAEASAYLYKTGDLGRYLPDGTIQFLGRIDHQVKIRGFRIELGEIEAAITQHPSVQEAVIIVREDRPGSKQLCAYVVSQPQQTVEIAALRQTLRQKLPDYMVPAFIMPLEQLPLTNNGKVDRKALPQPEGTGDRPSIVLPQTQVERQIAQVWADLLGTSTIGLHDNFFDLGGHSLLMVQVQAKLQTLLQRELNIVDLFQFPTIAQLANHLQHQQNQGSATEQAQQRTEVRVSQQSTLQQRRALRQQFRNLADDD